MRCSADRLAAYFAGVSELSLVVSDECAAVVTSVDGFDKLGGEEQDAAIDRAFEVPCRISEDDYGPNMWGRTVVRVPAHCFCTCCDSSITFRRLLSQCCTFVHVCNNQLIILIFRGCPPFCLPQRVAPSAS